MKSFTEITQKFQDFTTLRGMALFSRDGRFIDTSLPLSDEFSEDIGQSFHRMVEGFRAQNRVNNRIVIQLGENHFVYAEHSNGAFLFMMEGESEIDAVLGAFSHMYPAMSIPKEVVAPAGVAVMKEQDPVEFEDEKPRSKRSPLAWAIPGAVAAAITITVGVSSVTSLASAENNQASIAQSLLEKERLIAKEAAEAARLEKVRMEAEARAAEAVEKARMEEEARILAEQKAEMEAAVAAEEARKAAEMKAAEMKAAEEARLAAEVIAAEEARIAAEVEAKKIAAQKKAATKKTSKKSARRKYSKKPKTHCMND